MTEWNNVKNFINSHEKFTRKEFYEYGCNSVGEQYLILIRKVGFIKRVDVAKHERIIMIPEVLTTTKLNKLVNDKLSKLKYMRQLKLSVLNKNLFTE